MRRLFSFIDKNVDRVGYWFSFYIIVSGVWAGLVKHSSRVLPPMNWADAIIIGISATTCIIFVGSLAALAWRVIRQISDYALNAENKDARGTLYIPECSYSGDHETLMLFVVQHLIPTCEIVRAIQIQIIRSRLRGLLAEFAESGLMHSGRAYQFENGYEQLAGLGSSPTEFIHFENMIDAVFSVENGYVDFVTQAEKLARESEFSIHDDPTTGRLWNEWRDSHVALVAAYKPIKQNSRMGKLFRPAREDRWGRPGGLNALNPDGRLLLRADP